MCGCLDTLAFIVATGKTERVKHVHSGPDNFKSWSSFPVGREFRESALWCRWDQWTDGKRRPNSEQVNMRHTVISESVAVV